MTANPGHDETMRSQRAAQWCVRLATGRLDDGETADFEAWMAADPGNAAAFDRATSVWHGLQAVNDAPEIIGMRADALEAMRRANHRRWSGTLASGWRWGIAAAASLLLVLGASLLLLPERPTVYATAIGERRALVLPDGSRLSMDAETRVAVLYRGDHRAVTLLAGRAKFDVAKDPARPFTVTAGERTVVATGTAFTVELLGRQLHVIVYEGHVAVLKGDPPPPRTLLAVKARPDRAAASLSPGRELVTDIAPGATARIAAADVARSLSWEGGQLDFVDEPLAAAVERINRYSAEKIVIGDPRTASIAINGVFNAGDPAAFAEAVSAAYPVRVEHDGASIVLVGDGGR